MPDSAVAGVGSACSLALHPETPGSFWTCVHQLPGGGGHRILLALLLQRLPLNSFFQAVFQSIPDIDGLRTEPN